MLNALDVAYYFICQGENDPEMTQLKLQKLVYYAQGFHLGLYGTPLFLDEIQAWEHGPVIYELRRAFGHCGPNVVRIYNLPLEKPVLSHPSILFINAIWKRFGAHTANSLVNMTHAESPWKSVYSPLRRDAVISVESMKEHFAERCQELVIEEMIDVSTDNATCFDLDDLEREISSIAEPIEPAYSDAYLEFSGDLARKLTTQTGQTSQDELEQMSKVLASYRD
jgi:uncharacterized phage-associated protein